jgi:hypothetical protein
LTSILSGIGQTGDGGALVPVLDQGGEAPAGQTSVINSIACEIVNFLKKYSKWPMLFGRLKGSKNINTNTIGILNPVSFLNDRKTWTLNRPMDSTFLLNRQCPVDFWHSRFGYSHIHNSKFKSPI